MVKTLFAVALCGTILYFNCASLRYRSPESEPPGRPIEEGAYNLTDIKIEKKLNGLLVRIDATQQMKEVSGWYDKNTGWFNVTFYGGIINPHMTESLNSSGDNYIKKATPIQFPESAQLSLQVGGNVQTWEIFQDKRSNSIFVSLFLEEDMRNPPGRK